MKYQRPMLGLDSPQLRGTLEFIKSYIAEHGKSPTYQEIADSAPGGVNARSTVKHQVDRLVELGALTRDPATPYRALRVADRPVTYIYRVIITEDGLDTVRGHYADRAVAVVNALLMTKNGPNDTWRVEPVAVQP